ncbi:MAG: tetratricopeptide repeat protein [Planctomycetes bacterium]|nr:tetratricopeptide repeat protein [Planctomycetota bacterium]
MFVIRKIILLICTFCLLFLQCVAKPGCKPWDKQKKQWQSRKLLVPSEQIPDFPSQAIVVLAYLGRTQRGTVVEWPRVAFAIGDGTLILTAAHCVQGFADPRRQAVSPDVVVISPYYGDVFEFEILAVDEDADLAVLKAPWPAHPALTLATDVELKAAKEILVTGYPQQKIKKAPFRFSHQVRMEKLPVLKINEKPSPESIVLRGSRFGGPGWSGSALVLPGIGKVVGILCRQGLLKAKEKSPVIRTDLLGCGILSIKTLLEQHGLESSARQRPPRLQPVDNAERAFSLAMDYIESMWNEDSDKILTVAQQLADLRPKSVQAHLFIAFSAQGIYKIDSSRKDLITLAESSFEEALRLQPENARAHAGYGNFLMERERYDQALKETETALAIKPENELALANRVHILTQKNPEKAEELARQLVEKDPNNPHWWFWYRGALTKLGRNEEALDAAQKAVELNPDGFYSGGLAEALFKLGRMDEAQVCYQKMTRDCGCQLCWFKYARFLINNRPDKLDEAEKALDTSEAKTAKRTSQESLNLLRLKLLQKKSPEKAEVLAQQLLEASPENGDYWWALAGILRTLGKHEQAVQAASKAVHFYPDRSYHSRLADCLAKAGRLQQAQQTYNEMLTDHPERPKYWFWYARFLNEYYPQKLEEARQALEKAQTASDKEWSVPPEDLTDLREKINVKANAPEEVESRHK